MKYCPFCDGTEEYRFLKTLTAMRVIYPKNPVLVNHYLITPIRHVRTIDRLSDTELQEFAELLRLLINNVEEVIGYNIVSNNGSKEVNQQVPHAHIHVFLRLKDDVDPLKATHDNIPSDFSTEQLEHITQMKRQLTSERL